MSKMLAWFIAKFLKSKLNLQEGPVTDSKKWYVSKTVWSGIVVTLIGAYNLVGSALGPVFGFSLPLIPQFVYDILAALGLYIVGSRVSATQKIG